MGYVLLLEDIVIFSQEPLGNRRKGEDEHFLIRL